MKKRKMDMKSKPKPHSDSSSRPNSFSEVEYRRKNDIPSYEVITEVSSGGTVQTAVTWKTTFSSVDEHRTVTFQLDLPKIDFQEKNFQLNRKLTEKSISLDTSSNDPSK